MSDHPVKKAADVHISGVYREKQRWERIDIGAFLLSLFFVVYICLDYPIETMLLVLSPFAVCGVILGFLPTWNIAARLYLTCTPVKKATNAEFVYIRVPIDQTEHICPIVKDDQQRPWFVFRNQKFRYCDNVSTFEPVSIPIYFPLKYFYSNSGLSSTASSELRKEIGTNTFDIPKPKFSSLFMEQATAPFFVFQVFCVFLWLMDDYWYYALLTLFMLVVFEATVTKSRIRNLTELRSMRSKPFPVSIYRDNRWVQKKSDHLCPGDVFAIAAGGALDEETVVPCDALLLKGACVVDEATLTGESLPQRKVNALSSAPDKMALEETLDFVKHRKSILFGGTSLVQLTSTSTDSSPTNHMRLFDIPSPPNGGCVAYALRTGFDTEQGQLLRTIVFSTSQLSANSREAFAFIGCLFFFAVLAAGYVCTKGLEDKERSRMKIFIDCSLILTSVIPPELPMELSLAVQNSLVALSKQHIFCTEPFRIPLAGKLRTCCFDKTGTLTSSSLRLLGVFMHKSPSNAAHGEMEVSEKKTSAWPQIHGTMGPVVLAGCHSLVRVGEKVMGDSVERAGVSGAGWVYTGNDTTVSSEERGWSLRIQKRFSFSSSLKRMSSVAVEERGGKHKIYALVKGAPEVIKTFLKDPPETYDKECLHFTLQGHRVLALAWKQIAVGAKSSSSLSRLSRDGVESDLEFAGFAVFHCPFKKDTKATIRELQSSLHEIVMVTGDHPLTACHVASDIALSRKPFLVLTKSKEDEGKLAWVHYTTEDRETSVPLDWPDSREQVNTLARDWALCVTGEALRAISPNLSTSMASRDAMCATPLYSKRHVGDTAHSLIHLVLHTVVFSRCSPEQKTLIVETLKSAGHGERKGSYL
eukprot:Rmarinus@m.12517